MKKLLQLILISSSLLFIFSCSGDGTALPDESSELNQTWQLRSMSAYDSNDCASSPLFTYNNTTDGAINITSGDDCDNLALFYGLTNTNYTSVCPADINDVDGDTDVAETLPTLELSVMMYLKLTSTDSLSSEAGGTYQKTMYGEYPNGLQFETEYSTYGRFYTYGNKMATQILATILPRYNLI